VMGPSLVVIIYAIVGTFTTIHSMLASQGSGSRRLLRTPLVGGALLPWAYLLIVRPWHSRWGATEEEVRRALPYDHFVPDPIYQTTRAVTIGAPPGEVWRWLVQLGQGRGGLYSYDWLENLADLDVHSAEVIVPELQDLKVGDLVRLAPESIGAEAGLRVAAMEPGRALVLHQPTDPHTGRPIDRDDPGLENYYGWNWAFVLEETDGGSTRLIVRSRIDGSPRTLIGAFYTLLLEFPHFVMERAMLMGIKRRAERTSVAPKASRRFQHETTIGRPVEEVFDFAHPERPENDTGAHGHRHALRAYEQGDGPTHGGRVRNHRLRAAATDGLAHDQGIAPRGCRERRDLRTARGRHPHAVGLGDQAAGCNWRAHDAGLGPCARQPPGGDVRQHQESAGKLGVRRPH
jgi:hypothetical protein